MSGSNTFLVIVNWYQEGIGLKKLLFIMLAVLFLAACSDDSNAKVEANEDIETEQKENDQGEFDIDESTEAAKEEAFAESEDTEKELYLTMLNNLLFDYEEKYEVFTLEAGSSFYDLVTIDIDSNGIEAAKENTDRLLDMLKSEQQEAFSEFLDDLIELEEEFSHLDWSD